MKKLMLSTAVAALAVVALAAAALAADQIRDREQLRDRDQVATLLGLDREQLVDLRAEGLSLAQIAERQQVDPQPIVDALRSRWAERIQARVENGALTEAEAAPLRTQLETRARDMVYRTLQGGMQGAAVGAGPQQQARAGNGAGSSAGPTDGSGQSRHGAGAGQGAGADGNGAGACDGTGPHGPGQP